MTDAAGRRRRLHHARPQPAARRARRRAQRARPAWTSCSRGDAQEARSRAQAALIAVDPRTGEILALVGGRSYNQSQYNRATDVAPPAGLGVQAVRLSRRLRARGRGRAHRPHAGLADARRAGDVRLRRPGLGAEELRRLRRRDHAGGARWRCRATSARSASASASASTTSPRSGGASASAQPPRGYPVDHARRVRADAARSGAGLHAVHQRRRGAAAAARSITSQAGATRADADAGEAEAGRAARHDVPRHQHDAQRAQRRHRRRRARGRASRSTPPARAARPTICATPGSSASRRSC